VISTSRSVLIRIGPGSRMCPGPVSSSAWRGKSRVRSTPYAFCTTRLNRTKHFLASPGYALCGANIHDSSPRRARILMARNGFAPTWSRILAGLTLKEARYEFCSENRARSKVQVTGMNLRVHGKMLSLIPVPSAQLEQLTGQGYVVHFSD
jgi:hypothetical protein